MISKKAKKITPSLTLIIAAKANKLASEGKNIVSFTAGEPDFNTPDFIVEAAKVAMDKGQTRYTAASGILPLKQAICDKLKKDNNLEYTPNQIVVSNGAKHSLYNALCAVLDNGDEVLVPSPYWLSYIELVMLAGGKPKVIQTTVKDGYKLTPTLLKKSITPKTKAIFINNPSNPSGVVYSKKELEELAMVLEKVGIFVVSDEIYEKLIYDGTEYYSLAQFSEALKERTIVVNGLSKAYAMTGWRIGYTASNLEIAQAMDNIQSHTTSNANTIAQYASLAALSDARGDEFLDKMQATFASRAKLLTGLLDSIKTIKYIKPQGAFYVMVDISHYKGKTLYGKKISSASDVAELLVDKALVITIPCEPFGAPNFIRLSYATSDDKIKLGAERIKEFFKKSN